MKIHLCKICGEDNPKYFYVSNKSTCKLCILGKSKDEYNPHKNNRKVKPYQCKFCGETNPLMFYELTKSCCRKCDSKRHTNSEKEYNPHKTTVIVDDNGNRVKIHKCHVCGEDNPIEFNKSSKGRCKKCQRDYDKKQRELNYVPKKRKFRMPKPYLCNTCGEDNPIEFNKSSKTCCKQCAKSKYVKSNKKPVNSKTKRASTKNTGFQRVTRFKYINGNKYYPCSIHGNVLVGNNRKFVTGCPTCNIETYKNCIKNKIKLPKKNVVINVLLNYDEAKKRVNKLGITSHKQYRLWKKRTCQDDLPSNPERVYKNKGWVDYYTFFNTDKFDSMSAGEKRILNYLKRKNIKFVTQKKFDDCKNIYRLPFDFYLPDYNVLIEFDGEQHFKKSNFSKSDEINRMKFEQIQKNDRIKTRYCAKNNIILLRFDTKDLANNIIEWSLDNELTRILAEKAVSGL
jgi:very-short-patch-repair endonuclease